MKIRFIHLSDFHLNNNTLEDWSNYIKPALQNLIRTEKGEIATFIVISGDLIDKGGNGNISKALATFQTTVLDELVNSTQPEDKVKVFFVPGNHDIDRNADKATTATGIRSFISSSNTPEINKVTNSLINEEDKSESHRILAFKEWEYKVTKDLDCYNYGYLSSSAVCDLNGYKVGFALLNTAWCCWDDNDKIAGVALGEQQVKNALNFINDCQLKVVLLHHPLDWLKAEQSTVRKWIFKDFQIAFMGHVHEGDTTMESKHYGSLFSSIAPSFTNDIRKEFGAFANGLVLLEFDSDEKLIKTKFYQFSLAERAYILSPFYHSAQPDFIEFPIPQPSSSQIQDIITNSLYYLRTERLPKYEELIIQQKAGKELSIEESFILPRITLNGDSSSIFSLDSIISSLDSNIMLYGTPDCGRTMLLLRLAYELVNRYDEFYLLPVYINFKEWGNEDIDTLIKYSLDLNSRQYKALIETKQIVLLVDDFDVADEYKHKIKKIRKFIEDRHVKLICTGQSNMTGFVPNKFVNDNPIAFKYLAIHPLTIEQIKGIMYKWSPDIDQKSKEDRIEDLVKNFKNYSLQPNPMSVLLYLWSSENSDRKPVNSATLLDIYIETILEKLDKENIYRNSFDYHNKIMLIAYLANIIHDKFVRDTSYNFEYTELLNETDKYLSNVGFERIKADNLLNYFIKVKLFIREGKYIRFAHSCFYHFFLAKRMIDNADFKQIILADDNYYKYEETIDLYGGLKRNDKELLELLLIRFNEYFEKMLSFFNKNEYDTDRFFTYVYEEQQEYIPIIDDIKLVNIIEDRNLQQIRNEKENKYNRIISRIEDNGIKLHRQNADLMIVMLSKALSNLDGIEDKKLKYDTYSQIVKVSLRYAIVTKEILAHYANEHNGQLPSIFKDIVNVGQYLRFLPYIIQTNLSSIMKGIKMTSIFKQRFYEDLNNKLISDIEQFFSLGMIWDSIGPDSKIEVKEFLRRAKNNVSLDYLLAKMMKYYKYKVTPGSERDNQIIDLIVDFKSRKGIINKLLKSREIKRLKENRDRLLLNNSKG